MESPVLVIRRGVSHDDITSVDAGYQHTCFLTRQGHAYCSGSNTDGQLGDGTYKDRNIPTMVVRNFFTTASTTTSATRTPPGGRGRGAPVAIIFDPVVLSLLAGFVILLLSLMVYVKCGVRDQIIETMVLNGEVNWGSRSEAAYHRNVT